MTLRSTTSTLAITMLGALEVCVDGAPIRPLRGRSGEWLLALLVLRHDREVPRDWLAATLWPDSQESQARANLRRTLTDLRQALGEAAHRLTAPTPYTLSLSLTEAEADIVAFDAAIRRGDPTSLEQAIALYRGPLLENCLEEWALESRIARQQDYLDALQALANRAIERGEGGAASLLHRLLAADPYRESACRRLMECLAKESGFAAVTEVYRDLRLRLRQDFNADPDPETSSLYQRLRAEARLRARTAQVTIPKPEAEGSVSRSSIPATGRLPRPLTPLIGRRKEIAEIVSLLECHRLVTLTGTGGLGKTRLAIQVAEQQAEAFIEGVWFVGLAALSDHALVPKTVASALGIQEAPGHTPLETLTEYLRKRNLLLVLDNCEHLLEACAHLCATLLAECPTLHILATSRQATGILGEVSWRVPSLALPEPEHPVETLLKCESVRLFVERATLIVPNFALTERNASAVVQICQQLDGIPLAIELAAARVRVLSAEQVAARLKDRFRLLSGGNPTAMPRHQTLRACLDWSYDLLSEEERRLLRRLSVFAGGWTLTAAENVCGDENLDAFAILDGLTSLTEKSLMIAEEDVIGERRYRLLETVRQYLQEHLKKNGELALMLRRHCAWYLALAETAKPQLTGPEQAEWLVRLETEHDNMRVALRWCRETAEQAEAGLRLAGALCDFWHLRGHWREGYEQVDWALEREGAQSRTIDRVRALNGAGTLALALSDFEGAQEYLEACLSLSRELGNKSSSAVALINLGRLASRQSNETEARALFVEGMRLSRELGDKSSLALSLNCLGNVAYKQGDMAEARTFYQECLSLYREVGDTEGIVGSLNNLGMLACAQGAFAEARDLLVESLAGYRELRNKKGIVITLSNLGDVAYGQGDYAEAQILFEEGLVIARELGDTHGLASGLLSLGMVAFQQGDKATAQTEFEESLRLLWQMGDRYGIAYALEKLAGAFAGQADSLRAARLWGAAAGLRQSVGIPRLPDEQGWYEKQVQQVRSVLGEEAFATAWQEGGGLTVEQAVKYALSSDEQE